MKYCPNCGQQVSEGIMFCSYCGASLASANNGNVNQAQPNTQQNYYQPNMQQNNFNNQANVPKVTEKNIVVTILLSMVTCGIYGIIWYINMVNDLNTISDEKSPSGGSVFLFTLITCGIYGIIWEYKAGQRLYATGKKYGKDTQDNSTLYLILAIFGLQIVNYCLIQSELNRYAEGKN